MPVRPAVQWAIADLKRGLAGHDASKLMIAPILFVASMAVLDRAIYELELRLVPGTQERPTRL